MLITDVLTRCDESASGLGSDEWCSLISSVSVYQLASVRNLPFRRTQARKSVLVISLAILNRIEDIRKRSEAKIKRNVYKNRNNRR